MSSRTGLQLAKHLKRRWLREKDVVEEGGSEWKGKRETQIQQGDVFIKALIDGERSQY